MTKIRRGCIEKTGINITKYYNMKELKTRQTNTRIFVPNLENLVFWLLSN